MKEGTLESLVGKTVVLFWYDIERHDNVKVDPRDLPMCDCHTYGELVFVNDERVIMAQQRQREEFDYMIYPRGCVVGCTELVAKVEKG